MYDLLFRLTLSKCCARSGCDAVFAAHFYMLQPGVFTPLDGVTAVL